MWIFKLLSLYLSYEEDEDDDDWTHRAAPSTFFFIPIYNLLIVVDLFSLASLLGCGFLTPLLVVLLGGGGGGGGGGIPIGKTMGVFFVFGLVNRAECMIKQFYTR